MGENTMNRLLEKKPIFLLFLLTISFQVICLIHTYNKVAPDEFLLFVNKIQSEPLYQAIAMLVFVLALVFFVVSIYVFTLVFNFIANYVFNFKFMFNMMFKIIIIYMFFATFGIFMFQVLANNEPFWLKYLNPFVFVGLSIGYVIIRSEVKSRIRPLIFVGLMYMVSIILLFRWEEF